MLFFLFLFSLSKGQFEAGAEDVKVQAVDNIVRIYFNQNIDTLIYPDDYIAILPKVPGFWKWKSPHELEFIANNFLDDTLIYFLIIKKEIPVINGNTIEPQDIFFTAKKLTTMYVQQVPFQWENVERWDVEILWGRGLVYYTLKPKLRHYKSIVNIEHCWQCSFNMSVRTQRQSFIYPKFKSSGAQKYLASVDSVGCLYLIDKAFKMRYRWMIFPAGIKYQALDVSDNGEILCAFSQKSTDSITTVILFNPAGDVVWSTQFLIDNPSDTLIGLYFINQIDKVLIFHNEKLHCYKLYRAKY